MGQAVPFLLQSLPSLHINKGNTGRFKPMGIDGLAVVSAIIAQSDIKAAAAELKDLFCGKEKKHGF